MLNFLSLQPTRVSFTLLLIEKQLPLNDSISFLVIVRQKNFFFSFLPFSTDLTVYLTLFIFIEYVQKCVIFIDESEMDFIDWMARRKGLLTFIRCTKVLSIYRSRWWVPVFDYSWLSVCFSLSNKSCGWQFDVLGDSSWMLWLSQTIYCSKVEDNFEVWESQKSFKNRHESL